jgi:hypothetical protein
MTLSPRRRSRTTSPDAGPFERIERAGGSLGAILITEGRARRRDGARRGWCG